MFDADYELIAAIDSLTQSIEHLLLGGSRYTRVKSGFIKRSLSDSVDPTLNKLEISSGWQRLDGDDFYLAVVLIELGNDRPLKL